MKLFFLVFVVSISQTIAQAEAPHSFKKVPKQTPLNISCHFHDSVTSNQWEVKLGGKGKVRGILEKKRGLYLLDPAYHSHFTQVCKEKLKEVLVDSNLSSSSISLELMASPRSLFSFGKRKTQSSPEAIILPCTQNKNHKFAKFSHFLKKIATYFGYEFSEEPLISKRVASYEELKKKGMSTPELEAQLEHLKQQDRQAYVNAQVIHNALRSLILLGSNSDNIFQRDFESFVRNDENVTKLVALAKTPSLFKEAKERTQCRTESLEQLAQLIRLRNFLDSKAGSLAYRFYPKEKKLSQISKAHEEIQKEISTFQISSEDVVNSLTSGAGASLPAQFITFIESTLAKYFNEIYSKLSFRMQARFLADFLTNEKDPNNSPSLPYLLSVFIKYSGPLPQKVLQLLSESDIKDPELEAVLKKTREHLTPMSNQEVQEVIQEIFPDEKVRRDYFPEAQFDSSTFKAAATIGQVYIEKYRQSRDQKASPAAIKFLKKGIEMRLKSDHDILVKLLSQIQNAPEEKASYLQLVKNAYQTMNEETDLDQEFENLNRSHRVYRGLKDGHILYSVKPLNKFSNAAGRTKALVMEEAEGESLARLSQKYLDELKAFQGRDPDTFSKKEISKLNENLTFWLAKGHALANLLEVWTKEAILNGGEYHADLHGGNLFFKFDPKLPNQSKLTLIDAGKFGNYSTLDRHHFRTLVLSLGIMVKFDPQDQTLLSPSPQMVQNINNILVSLGKTFKNEKDPKWLELTDYILDLYVESRKLSSQDRTRFILKNLLGEGMTTFELPLSKDFQNFNMALEYPSEGLSQTIREITRHPSYIAQGSPALGFRSPSEIIEDHLQNDGIKLYQANALNAGASRLSKILAEVKVFMGLGPSLHLERSRFNLGDLKKRIETYPTRKRAASQKS